MKSFFRHFVLVSLLAFVAPSCTTTETTITDPVTGAVTTTKVTTPDPASINAGSAALVVIASRTSSK